MAAIAIAWADASPGSLTKKIFTEPITWRIFSKVFSLEKDKTYSGKEERYVSEH
jgi:hypothetical protein